MSVYLPASAVGAYKTGRKMYGKARKFITPKRAVNTVRAVGSQLQKMGLMKNKRIKVAAKKSITLARSQPFKSGFGQWKQSNKVIDLSRKTSKLNKLSKVVNQSKQKTIMRWNAVNPTFGDNGYYWFYNADDGQIPAARRYLPLYAFDLTRAINLVPSSTSGSVQCPGSCVRAYTTTIDGAIGFENTSNVSFSNNNTIGWLQFERYPGLSQSIINSQESTNNLTLTDTTALPQEGDFLKWADCRFNFYGCKKRPTKINVSLVRFLDDDLVPTSEDGANIKRTSVFQNMLKTMVQNPIAVTSSAYRNRVKVLKSETINIEPANTTDEDTSPNVRSVKWFLKLNRFIKYVERQDILGTASSLLDETDFAVNGNRQMTTTTQKQYRLFLIITSTNFGKDVNAFPNASVDYTPSFDMTVRLCHENFS